MTVQKLILFCALYVVSSLQQIPAQSKLLDSLRMVIAAPKNSKAKADALNRYGFELRNRDKDSSRVLAKEALALSRNIAYNIGIGEACYILGTLHYLRNNDSALVLFKKSLEEYGKATDAGLIKMSRTYNGISNVFMQLTKYDSAIHYSKVASAYIMAYKDTGRIKTERLMYCWGSLGHAYYDAGYYDSSISYYLKAAAAGEKLNNHQMLTSYYHGIANIHATGNDYASAIAYGNKSAKIAAGIKDYESLVHALANIGGYYSRIDSFTQAQLFIDSSLKTGRLYDVTDFISTNYSTLGTLEIKHKNCPKAIEYFKAGLELTRSGQDNFMEYVLLHKIADAYMCTDSLERAKENYLLALQAGAGDIDHEAGCCIGLSEVYLKLGDYKNAHSYLQKGRVLYDSVFSAEKLKIITELNTRYETGKKEQQLILLEKEKQLHEKEIAQQQQQIINSELLAKQQQHAITMNELESEKQQQQMQIQTLTLVNNKTQLQKQQLTIINTSNKLKVEQQQKEIQAATINTQKNRLLLLTIFVCAAAIISWLFFNRYKLNRKIEGQQALISERLRISRELHDEVGATLSGISMYSHLTKEQMKNAQPQEVEKSLNIMQQSAGEMVNKLNDIVWLVNPEQDTLQKLVQRLEEYATDMATIKNMQVKVNAPMHLHEYSLPIESRRNIYLFCKEAINNAVKYSNGSLVELTIKELNKTLSFSVSDNGKGFDAMSVKRGNGLENMQKRAGEIGARLTLQSKPGEGCVIAMQIKIT